LRLADRYGAPEVVEAAAAAAGIDVALVAENGLAWATGRAAYPAEDSPAPAPALRQYAADALQELFGDLETVWAYDGAKQSSLLALPHAAIMALLADERTRVASENTVMHTIEDWLDEYELEPDSAQAEELLALVRVARLTPHYARTVFCESELAKAHLSQSELTLASMLPLVGDGPVNGLCNRQHWRLPARPRSALADAVVLEWCPTLAELEACVTSLPAEGEGRSTVDGPKDAVWQGWPLNLQMHCRRTASDHVELWFSLTVEPPLSAAGALIEHTFEAVAASGGGGVTASSNPCLFTFTNKSWTADGDFFGLGKAGGDGNAGPPKEWAGVEAALRAKRLVHGGGDEEGEAAHLKLRCTVTRLE
jgi:hypothetical protein